MEMLPLTAVGATALVEHDGPVLDNEAIKLVVFASAQDQVLFPSLVMPPVVVGSPNASPC